MLEVPAVAPETDVATVIRLMRRMGVRHLPVVEQRQCVGLVGERELAGATGPDDLVGLLCRRPAPCVPPDADRRRIDEQLCREHADALGVLDGVRFVGLLEGDQL
ncbi:CBS domain protein [Kutzneria sp. CA-103260]|nr:CBS domain protein [Kutzneria sp. CA-103260]